MNNKKLKAKAYEISLFDSFLEELEDEKDSGDFTHRKSDDLVIVMENNKANIEISKRLISEGVELEPNDYEIRKIRNGCWQVFKNGKKFSEHSLRSGAERFIKNLY